MPTLRALALITTLIPCLACASSALPNERERETGARGATNASGANGDNALDAKCGDELLRPFDDARECFRPEETVGGICRRSLGKVSASLEVVCAVDANGTLYLLVAAGDAYLSGDGWTFGPRKLGPDGIRLYDVEPSTLSGSDLGRCDKALGVSRFGAGQTKLCE